MPAADERVELRPYPYPFRALLAICSDLDETPDARVYREIMCFLNTPGETFMGPGAGLEVGNTMYFDMERGNFAYWNTDDRGRAMIRTLIHSGHIDCLHSYGDLATTRAHAGRALEELDRWDCRLEVWIDHAVAPTNFGADIMQGHGDEPGHPAYHADLTAGFGVRYVWRGRVTSVIGQEAPPSLGGIFDRTHPVSSLWTVAKEAAKHALARQGHQKYAMHADNRVLRRSMLRDGTPVYEFLRCNPHWGGVSSCDTGRGIGRVLTARFLDRLVERGGVCVLYTHLGKICHPEQPFDDVAIAAFHRLADRMRAGHIGVLTTRRLLRYLAVRDRIDIAMRREGGSRVVTLRSNVPEDRLHPRLTRDDLGGLTFYTSGGRPDRVELDDTPVVNVRVNPPDHTGRPSMTIPLPRLEFPPI